MSRRLVRTASAFAALALIGAGCSSSDKPTSAPSTTSATGTSGTTPIFFPLNAPCASSTFAAYFKPSAGDSAVEYSRLSAFARSSGEIV